MEKTIYDLEEAQRVYYKGYNDRFEPIVCSMLYSAKEFAINKRLVANLQNSNNLFTTEEDCQKSIDYDVALAKINKRASELEEKEPYCIDTFKEIYFDTFFNKLVTSDRPMASIRSVPLYFPEEYVWDIISELEEECKIVLGVE